MKIKQTQPDIIICSCLSTEHQIVVRYFEDKIDGESYPKIYIHTHLNKRPFWSRVQYGIKYIFGYQCRYGAFDEFIINPEDVCRIEKIVKYLKKM